MAGMTWLHLSDWHQGSEAFVKYQKSEAFDRDLLSKRLKQAILNRTSISPDLAKIDFCVFSGDVAFSGQPAEYQAAIEKLFTPVLEATGLDKNRLFIVPGNHDLDRRKFQYLPVALTHPFSSDAEVNQWLKEESDRKFVLIPFEAYDQFINRYTGQNHPTYASVVNLDIDRKKVALLGLNSALMCGRNKILKDGKEEVDDYGKLVVGEPQLEDGLEQIDEADVRIAVLHHPFEWLMSFERFRTKEQLGQKFHFILCGHEHFPEVNEIQGTTGHCLLIPAGAGFDRRVPEDPSYTNAYNFVHLNFDTGQVTVYLQRWNNRNRVWDKDTSKYPTGQVSFIFPKLLDHLSPKEEGPASPLPSAPVAKTPSSFSERANKAPVIKLTYQERLNLTDALLEVYPNQEDFEMMFEIRFNRRLNTLVDGFHDYRTRIYRLIERTEAEGWTGELVIAAHQERPRNIALQSWLQRYEAKEVTPEAQHSPPISPGIAEPLQNGQTITPDQEQQKGQESRRASPDEQPLLDKADLYDELTKSLPAVFVQIVVYLGVPKGILSGDEKPQAIRANELIQWAESEGDQGLQKLNEALQRAKYGEKTVHATNAPVVNTSVSPSPAPGPSAQQDDEDEDDISQLIQDLIDSSQSVFDNVIATYRPPSGVARTGSIPFRAEELVRTAKKRGDLLKLRNAYYSAMGMPPPVKKKFSAN